MISERPEEECQIEPQRNCKHVTKLVPQLKEHENCYDVPKEVCTRARTNPRSRVCKLYHGVPPTFQFLAHSDRTHHTLT